MASTEPKVQADHDLLGCLPTALAEQIWDSLSCSARQNLLATSRSLQAVFGSVVSSVDFTLPEDSGSGDPFRGLHPSIKPTRVAVKAVPSADLEDPDNHMGSFDSPCEDHPGLLQFISHSRDSQHLARLEFLVVAVSILLAAAVSQDPGLIQLSKSIVHVIAACLLPAGLQADP
jgi:hypothetical protein